MVSGRFASITNPILDPAPGYSVRDPLLFCHDGVVHCHYSAVERAGDHSTFYLETISSSDLVEWSQPRRLTDSALGFSSPGSIIRVGDGWVMSLQSYPILPGEKRAGESARLWLMASPDLENWNDPVPINPDGARVNWSESRRQIDPCLVEHDGRYWCLYKTSGCLGLLVSDDLARWQEASPDRPVFGRDDSPDGSPVENPCVLRVGDEFVLFFTPCREGRGVGVARSRDLVSWRDARYLDFPDIPWAQSGPSAAMVIDLRATFGKWVMAFHGERKSQGTFAAALGLAWSDDLEHWVTPHSR